MSTPADRLRQNREAVTTGKLSLDREQARRKLQLFRLPSPYQYVLQFVRAASVLGATEISFDVRAMTLTCTFDAVLERELLEDIWSPMFGERSSVQQHAAHNLALGLASAQGLNPWQIEVRSGATRLVLTQDGGKIELVDDEPRTTIRVDQKFRFGHVVDFFASILDMSAEAHYLRKSCSSAFMRVQVNDRLANTHFEGEEVLEVDTERGVTRVLAAGDLTETTLVLLRDDVEIASFVRPRHIVGIHAAINSREVATDLSGLALREAADPEWDALTATIHRAVREWVEEHLEEDLSAAMLHRELELLATFANNRPSAAMSSESLRLIEFILAQPIFRSAIVDDTERITLRKPEDGAVLYATERVVLPDESRPIVLLRPNSPIPHLLQRAKVPLRDMTTELVERSIGHRNRKRWEQRVVVVSHELREAADRRIIEVGDLKGMVRVAAVGEGSGREVLRRRLLGQRDCPLPFAYLVTGDLRPNARFDSVERDETYEELAIAMYDATLDLFGELDADGAAAALEHIVTGHFERQVFAALGYDESDALPLLTKYGRNFRDDDPWGWSIAGPLPKMKTFSGCSLEEIVAEPQPPMFSRSARHVPGRMVLALTPTQERIVRLLRPDSGTFEQVVWREEALKRFESRGPFRHDPSLNPLWRHTASEPDFELELCLLPDDRRSAENDHTSVVFVLNGYELTREDWTSFAGRWLAVARSTKFSPHYDYRGIIADPLYDRVRATLQRHMQLAFKYWMADCLHRGFVEPQGTRIFVKLMLTLNIEDMQLPVSRFDGENWTRGFASVPELRAAATRGRDILHWIVPGEEFHGLYIAGDLLIESPPDPIVRAGILPGVSFVHAGDYTVSSARREYASRALHRSSLDDAVRTWQGTIGGFYVQIGLYVGEPRLDVEVLWLNRVLETLSEDAPGRFLAIVQGEIVDANEDLTAVGKGRDEALQAARAAMNELIEEACRHIADRGVERLPDRLDRVRDALLALSKSAAPNEPWRELLETTPLVELPNGQRISLREHRGATTVLDEDLLRRVVRRLDLARGDRRDLLPDFTLAGIMWSAPEQVDLCIANSRGVMLHPHHELTKLAASSGAIGEAFLASCAYTQINAFYAEVTDTDEIAFQHRLLVESV